MTYQYSTAECVDSMLKSIVENLVGVTVARFTPKAIRDNVRDLNKRVVRTRIRATVAYRLPDNLGAVQSIHECIEKLDESRKQTLEILDRTDDMWAKNLMDYELRRELKRIEDVLYLLKASS